MEKEIGKESGVAKIFLYHTLKNFASQKPFFYSAFLFSISDLDYQQSLNKTEKLILD